LVHDITEAYLLGNNSKSMLKIAFKQATSVIPISAL